MSNTPAVNWVPDRPVPWISSGTRPEKPIYPKPPKPGPEVQVYARNVILANRKRVDPLNGVTYGDLAVLPDGRLRSRRQVRMNDGSTVLCYAPFDPDGNPELFLPPAVDWLARLEHLITQAGSPGFHVLEPPPRTEKQRFVAEFPELARELGVEPDASPAVLFNVGRTLFPKTLAPGVLIGLAPDVWREFVLEHALGHWGKDGDIRQVGPLTEVMTWTAEEHPQSVQNALAIAAGRGAVRSRRWLPAWALEQMPRPYPDNGERWGVQISTVLGRSGGNQTLMTVTAIGD